MKNTFKSGVSLIAVLLFMLAATTASVVVFRWLAQENFSSGARLKGSEAFQASQAGLEATKGWLANKGADVGAVLKIFEANGGKPVKLVSQINSTTDFDILAGKNLKAKRQQKFDVYLTAAHTSGQTYKLKFLSIGTARDGSKHTQAGIFEVEGLYKVVAYVPTPPGEAPEATAFWGGMSGNTQGKFESATIQGDANINGISTSGRLIVTGNLTTADNAQSRIGCKSATDNTRAGDMYVLGTTNIRKFTVCGDAYVGGHTTAMGPKFLRDFYANGGITNNGGEGVTIGGNLTLGGDYNLRNSANTIGGNLVLDKRINLVFNSAGIGEHEFTNSSTEHGFLVIQNDSKITVGGDVWSMKDLFKAVSGNKNDNNKYEELKLSNTDGKKLYIPDQNAVPQGKARVCGNSSAYGCGGQTNRWYQHTYGTDTAHFRIATGASHQNPTMGNKPTGAKFLDSDLASLGEQIKECVKPGGGTYKCVPDPLTVPKTGGVPDWKVPSQKLKNLVSAGDTANLPKACIRLVKSPANAGGNYDSQWCFGDGLNSISNPSASDYPSMSGGYNFIKAANDCYAKLKVSDPKKILYPESETDASKKFLPLEVKPNSNGRSGYFNGNFIFYFVEKGTNIQMNFPPTTNDTKVFVYFQEGYEGNIPWTNSCVDGYCKRNYFIFSEQDIKGSSGSGTLNGTLFLANGAKLTDAAGVPDLTIDFNKELYQALVDMGIVVGATTSSSQQGGVPPQQDEYYIPSTSHLKVKLESQYTTEEGISSNDSNNKAKPSIIVLPRVIYLNTGDISDFNANPKKYYKVLYMNGATEQTVPNENSPTNCTITAGTYDLKTCNLESKSSCNGSIKCQNNFYVVEATSSLGAPSSSSGGAPFGASSSSATLFCSGIAGAGEVKHGTKVNAPTLTCSNGATPSSISWISDAGPFTSSWWGANGNIPAGTFNNIRATATCGTGGTPQSNSCGNLKVTFDNTLSCSITPSVIAAGSPISANLICGTGNPTNPRYSNVGGSQTSLEPGTYDNISVTADCSLDGGGLVPDLTATCPGTLTVVKLNCDRKELYAKPDGTISTGDRPTMSCYPAVSSPTDESFTAPSAWNWTVPPNSPAGFEYNITGNAKCSNLPLTADCGKVTVAGITCSGLPSTVQLGKASPAEPTLVCNNGGTISNKSYIINNGTPSYSWPTLSTNVANQYEIKGTATCNNSKTYLQSVPFTCPTVSVVGITTSDCAYSTGLCNGMPFSAVVTTVSQTNNWVSGQSCFFASSISQIGNNVSGEVILVNGQKLPGKSTGDGNPEGRCGGTGDWWKTDNQLSCTDALVNIPKMDGGYYIYIPPGGVGQNFTATGGTKNTQCNTARCEYKPEWCGNKAFADVVGNSTTKPIIAGTCLFISDFTYGAIQPGSNTTISINGERNVCGGSGNCSYSNKPPKADGGYYVYLESGTNSNGRWSTAAGTNSGIVAGTKTNNCGSTSAITCTLPTNKTEYDVNERITPIVTCPGGTASNMTFETSALASYLIQSPNKDGVCFNTASTSSTPRTIYLKSVKCNNATQTTFTDNTRINCGGVFVRELAGTPAQTCGNVVTVTGCTMTDIRPMLNGDSPRKTCYYIPRPSVTCSDNSMASEMTFEQNANNSTFDTTGLKAVWNTPTNNCPQAFCNPGTRGVRLAAVKCGNTVVTNGLPYDCGYFTKDSTLVATEVYSCSNFTNSVAVTSCTPQSIGSPNSSNNSYSVPRPNIVCSNGQAGATTFAANNNGGSFSALSNWKLSSDNQSFSTPGLKEIRLTAVKCGNTDVNTVTTSSPYPCGSINIPGATCKLVNRSNSEVTDLTVTQGENITAPAISCSNGAGDLNISSAVFSSDPAANLPTGSDTWKSGGTAYYTGLYNSSPYKIEVSNVKCGNTTFSGKITCGNITVNRPTCSGVSGTKTVNETITPAVSCGNATLGNRTFSPNSSSWTNNNTTGGYYTGIPSTNPNTIYLNSVYCDGNNISVTSNTQSCGNVTVNQAVGCGSSNAVAVKQNISVGDCMKTTACTTKLRLANYGTGSPKVKLTGGCSVNSYTVPNSNSISACNSTGIVYIEVIEGSATQFQVDCYN